jgi:hypothetical protein
MSADRWVPASVVAEHLSCERAWVYDHAGELGGRRLGSGPRARLRFRLDLVDEALTACSDMRRSAQPSMPMAERNPRRGSSPGLGRDVPLLPVRGRDLGLARSAGEVVR